MRAQVWLVFNGYDKLVTYYYERKNAEEEVADIPDGYLKRGEVLVTNHFERVTAIA